MVAEIVADSAGGGEPRAGKESGCEKAETISDFRLSDSATRVG